MEREKFAAKNKNTPVGKKQHVFIPKGRINNKKKSEEVDDTELT